MSASTTRTTRPGGTPDGRERGVRRTLTWIAVVIVVAVLAFAVSQATRARTAEQSTAAPTATVTGEAAAALVERDDSRRLNDAPDARVTFVEFLDFECEACAALYPVVEDLRATYGDDVSFVVRYFPLPGHFNSVRAARAVEAAAQQGRFNDMYALMYDTQAEWGEQQVALDDQFRTYAASLGLDMEQWDADYASDETAAFVQRDYDDAIALGLSGTPSFFLNGELIQPSTVSELTGMIDAALAE